MVLIGFPSQYQFSDLSQLNSSGQPQGLAASEVDPSVSGHLVKLSTVFVYLFWPINQELSSLYDVRHHYRLIYHDPYLYLDRKPYQRLSNSVNMLQK